MKKSEVIEKIKRTDYIDPEENSAALRNYLKSRPVEIGIIVKNSWKTQRALTSGGFSLMQIEMIEHYLPTMSEEDADRAEKTLSALYARASVQNAIEARELAATNAR